MTSKITKSVRFSKNEALEIERIAEEEGLSFSQIVSKLSSLGLAEFKQMRRYNLRDMRDLPEHLPIQQRKHIEISVQNNLMLETIIKSLNNNNDKDIVKSIRRSACETVKNDFLMKQ